MLHLHLRPHRWRTPLHLTPPMARRIEPQTQRRRLIPPLQNLPAYGRSLPLCWPRWCCALSQWDVSFFSESARRLQLRVGGALMLRRCRSPTQLPAIHCSSHCEPQLFIVARTLLLAVLPRYPTNTPAIRKRVRSCRKRVRSCRNKGFSQHGSSCCAADTLSACSPAGALTFNYF